MWPNRERRRAWTIADRRGCPVVRLTSSFRTWWYHLIPNNFRRHHWSRASILSTFTGSFKIDFAHHYLYPSKNSFKGSLFDMWNCLIYFHAAYSIYISLIIVGIDYIGGLLQCLCLSGIYIHNKMKIAVIRMSWNSVPLNSSAVRWSLLILSLISEGSGSSYKVIRLLVSMGLHLHFSIYRYTKPDVMYL